MSLENDYFQIDIQGLNAVRRTIKNMNPAIDKELRRGLKAAGDIVANQAKENARAAYEEGFYRKGHHKRDPKDRRTGDLVKKIATAVTQRKGVEVRLKARHRGYNYPRRLEFEKGKTPFLRPALYMKRTEARREIWRAVDRALKQLEH